LASGLLDIEKENGQRLAGVCSSSRRCPLGQALEIPLALPIPSDFAMGAEVKHPHRPTRHAQLGANPAKGQSVLLAEVQNVTLAGRQSDYERVDLHYP
jgi:hypothetical protein